MKNRILISAWILCLLLAGCTRKPEAGDIPAPGETLPAVSECYPYGEQISVYHPLMPTENGFYYLNNPWNSPAHSIQYCDIKTQKDIILCNKPECRHDGSEFCVATNEKYSPFAMRLYHGKLYVGATCTDGNAISFKLLCASMDGSDLTEISTCYTYDAPNCAAGRSDLFIHRGKAFLKMQIRLNPEIEDTLLCGTAVYDLETQQLSYLYETPLDADNPEWEHISAYQDYVYYSAMEGRKRLLHRYCLSDGTDETLQFKPGFRGNYIVMDEDTVYYAVDTAHFCAYHIGARSNQILSLSYTDNAGLEEAIKPSAFYTDGDYLYVMYTDRYIAEPDLDPARYTPFYGYVSEYEKLTENRSNLVYRSNILVYTPELKFVTAFHGIPDYKELTGKDYLMYDEYRFYGMEFHFMGDTVYLTSKLDNMYVGSYAVFALGREELLSGEGEFSTVFNP